MQLVTLSWGSIDELLGYYTGSWQRVVVIHSRNRVAAAAVHGGTEHDQECVMTCEHVCAAPYGTCIHSSSIRIDKPDNLETIRNYILICRSFSRVKVKFDAPSCEELVLIYFLSIYYNLTADKIQFVPPAFFIPADKIIPWLVRQVCIKPSQLLKFIALFDSRIWRSVAPLTDAALLYWKVFLLLNLDGKLAVIWWWVFENNYQHASLLIRPTGFETDWCGLASAVAYIWPTPRILSGTLAHYFFLFRYIQTSLSCSVRIMLLPSN